MVGRNSDHDLGIWPFIYICPIPKFCGIFDVYGGILDLYFPYLIVFQDI